MKAIRHNNRILGIAALTLLCLSFSAAPASAFLDRDGFDPAVQAEQTVGERVSTAVSQLQHSFLSLIQKLGGVFASQSGVDIED